MRRNPYPTMLRLPPACCIFKVPEALRRHNPKAYEPLVVSIGSFHRQRDHQKLQRMETVKQWYLGTLLTRVKISLEKIIESINNETEGITEFEKRARAFYAEPFDLTQREFIEIMILDGCFVIELLWKIVNGEKYDDPILKMDCMLQYVCHDLLLLENQLPWYVLSCLYRLTLGSYANTTPNFRVLLVFAFCSLGSSFHHCNSYLDYLNHHKVDDNEVLHILDLIRTSIVFTFKQPEEEDTGSDIRPPTSTKLQNYKKCLCFVSVLLFKLGFV